MTGGMRLFSEDQIAITLDLMQRRILHVVGAMNRGGVETWLMHVLRGIDRSKFKFDFLVHTSEESAYDEEIRCLGAQIHSRPTVGNPVKYARQVKALLHQHGPFDVVHSHVYLYSGFVMRLAAEAGVPIRIAHSHTALKQTRFNLPRLAYERFMRNWIAQYSTHRIGISRMAADSLFGKQAHNPAAVLYYGFDFSPFLHPQDPEGLKRQLGIPAQRKIIGHVGRFLPVKNHAFIAECFQRVVAAGADAHLLLVGDGPLVPTVRKDIESRGLLDRCTFAGVHNVVAPFLSAMDVFVFPSLYEGLGIVALEAQAAGLPVIASSVVPEEIDVIPNLVERISLEDGPAVWASAVVEKLRSGNLKRGDGALLLQRSSFALPVCIERLSRIYKGERIEDLAA
jgi:glycosyltransferase involved in cell wall biosynthesis